MTNDVAPAEGRPEGPVPVTLVGVAPGAVVDVLATLDALHREVQVGVLDTEPAAVDAPAVRGLVDDRARLETQRQGVHDQAVAARDAGAATVDITVWYQPEEVARVRSATDALGAANAAAQEGRLLVPPLTADQHHLWRYMADQFEAQVVGGAPTPFRPRT